MINPILDWTESDVWEFLRHYGCEGNPLYQCGESRIGCIGCPMAGARSMKNDFIKYPKYKDNYIRAFDRMLEAIKKSDKKIKLNWETGEDVMKWWLQCDTDQLTFDGFDIMEL